MVDVKNKVEGMEPVTDDVKALRLQAQGAGALGHWLIQIDSALSLSPAG